MSKELTPAPAGEVSAGAVACAKLWCETGEEQGVPDSSGDIHHLADLIQRLAVAPAVEENQRLIEFYIEEVGKLHERLATAEAEVERLDAELNSPLGQFQEARRLAVHWEEVAKGLEGEVERLREAGQFALFVFLGCDRIGAEKDEPEGVRFIQISDTLAKDAEGRLRHALAERREGGDGE